MNPPPAIKPAPKPARSRGSSPGPEHAEEPVPCITVASGGRVLIASDLHLGAVANAATEAASTELARRLERWNGPGGVVLAGDTFEMWAEPNNTPAKALRSHPRFTNAVARFAAGEGRSVVVLAGNHDGALGWDPELAAEVSTTLGAAVYHALDIEITTVPRSSDCESSTAINSTRTTHSATRRNPVTGRWASTSSPTSCPVSGPAAADG